MKTSAGVMCCVWLLACGGTRTPNGSHEAGASSGGSSDGRAGAGPDGEGGQGAVGSGGDAGGPVAPPAQGAVIFQVGPIPTPPVGTMCPSASFTSAVPEAPLAEQLSENNYQHKVVDGEDGAAVSCRVASDGGWSFSGVVRLAGRFLRMEDGSLSDQNVGTARITVSDSSRLSPASLASSEPCEVSAMQEGAGNLQIAPGAMWASFNCESVELPPSSACLAKGYFVLENCEQE